MASQSRASGLEDLTHIRYRTIVGREDVMPESARFDPGFWLDERPKRAASGRSRRPVRLPFPASQLLALVYCFDGHDSRCRTDDVPASHAARATGPRVVDPHCRISPVRLRSLARRV